MKVQSSHGEEKLLSIVLITITADMTRFVADVASLCAIGTVPRYMPHLVTIVARLRETSIVRIVRHFRTRTRNMPWFITVVARRRIRTLVAVFSDVTLAVAPVATICPLLAVSGVVTKAITLETFLTTTAESPISTSTVSTATSLRTFPRNMPRSVAFIAHVRTHDFLEKKNIKPN